MQIKNSSRPGYDTRLLLLILLLSGCALDKALPPPAVSDIPLPIQQAKRYPDLTTGRFLVLADMESPEQKNLFQLDPGGGSIKRTRKKAATGRFGLEVELGQKNPEKRKLLFTRGLPADWTDFRLLIISVWVPRPRDDFRLTLRSGQRLIQKFTVPICTLRKGWNTVKVDLGLLKEKVELLAIRAIEIQFVNAAPTDVFVLDDVMLVDNRRTIYRDPPDVPDAFSVRIEGDRLHVRRGGRFEYRFGPRVSPEPGGPITGVQRHCLTAAFCLADDPDARRNLLGGQEGLGPIPAALETQTADLAWWGTRAWSQWRLLEANAVRAVVQLDWSCFDHLPQWLTGQTADLKWRYTLYRDGSIFYQLHIPTERGGRRVKQLALRLGLDETFARKTRSVMDQGIVVRKTTKGPAIVVALAQTANAARDVTFDSPTARLYFRFKVLDYPKASWTGFLGILPGGDPAEKTADRWVAQFLRGPKLSVTTGRLIPNTDGDGNRDGFAEGRGCVVARALNGRFRCQLPQPGPAIAYELEALPSDRTYVQMFGQLIGPTARGRNGRFLFLLPPRTARAEIAACSPAPN